MQSTGVANWAESMVGRRLRSKLNGSHKVIDWHLGRKGKGVWFTLENGDRVYQQVPNRYRRR